MATIDMYGRSNDPRAAFGYPSTVMPLPRGPKLFVQLPSGANRIYGAPSQKMVMEDETRVQLDPSSTFEYTQRNHGLGGLGEDPKPGVTKSFLKEYVEQANDNPTALYFGLGILALVSLGALKMLGRVSGS